MKTVKQARREAKRLFRLCVVDGLLDERRVQRVVQRVVGANRRGRFLLLNEFLHRVKIDRSRHTAQVESAVPLPADLQASIETRLADVYGRGVRASFMLKPELIGGMRIKVGSDLYDGSVQAELAALEKSF